MLKLLGRVLFLGLVAAAVYALWKRLTGAVEPPVPPAPPSPPSPAAAPVVTPARASSDAPASSASAAPAPSGASAAWTEPADGACPVSHPVKAKLSSGIFHVPGGQNYDRTKADRCYADAAGAEADGLRQAKR
jgi:hypothetical protein